MLGADVLVEKIGMNSQSLYETIFQAETGAISVEQELNNPATSSDATLELADKALADEHVTRNLLFIFYMQLKILKLVEEEECIPLNLQNKSKSIMPQYNSI